MMGHGELHITEKRLLRLTATRSETEGTERYPLTWATSGLWLSGGWGTARVQKGLERLRPLTCVVPHIPEEGRVRL